MKMAINPDTLESDNDETVEAGHGAYRTSRLRSFLPSVVFPSVDLSDTEPEPPKEQKGGPYRSMKNTEPKAPEETCKCYACRKTINKSEGIKTDLYGTRMEQEVDLTRSLYDISYNKDTKSDNYVCSDECIQYIKESYEYSCLHDQVMDITTYRSDKWKPWHVRFPPEIKKTNIGFMAVYGDVTGIAPTPEMAIRYYDAAWGLTTGSLKHAVVEKIGFFNVYSENAVDRWRDNRNKFLDNIKLMKKLTGNE